MSYTWIVTLSGSTTWTGSLTSVSGDYSAFSGPYLVADIPLQTKTIGDAIGVNPNDIREGLMAWHPLQEAGPIYEDRSGNNLSAVSSGNLIRIMGKHGYGASLGDYPWGHIEVAGLSGQPRDYMCSFWFKPATLLTSGTTNYFTVMEANSFYGDHFRDVWDYTGVPTYKGWSLVNLAVTCSAGHNGDYLKLQGLPNADWHGANWSASTPAFFTTRSGYDWDVEASITLPDSMTDGQTCGTVIFDSNSYLNYCGFRLSKGGVYQTQLVDGTIPRMTNYSAPTPYVVSASSEYSTTYRSWYAFDSDLNTRWCSTAGDPYPRWIKLDCSASGTKVVQGYRMYRGSEGNFPRDWTFQGSDNDVDWTTLHTMVGQPNPTVSTWTGWFTFSNYKVYRYYRWRITASNDSSYTRFYSAEFIAKDITYSQTAGTISLQVKDLNYVIDSNPLILGRTYLIRMKKRGNIVTFKYRESTMPEWITTNYYADTSTWGNSIYMGVQSYNTVGTAPQILVDYFKFRRGIKPTGWGDPVNPGRILVTYNQTDYGGVVEERSDSRLWLHLGRDFVYGTAHYKWNPDQWYLLQFGAKTNALSTSQDYCWWVNAKKEKGSTVGSGVVPSVLIPAGQNFSYFDPEPLPTQSGSFQLDEVSHWNRWLTGEEILKMINKVSQVSWNATNPYPVSTENLLATDTTRSGDLSQKTVTKDLYFQWFTQYQSPALPQKDLRINKISFRQQADLKVYAFRVNQQIVSILRGSSGWMANNLGCYCTKGYGPLPIVAKTASHNSGTVGNLFDGTTSTEWTSGVNPNTTATYLKISYDNDWTRWKAFRFQSISNASLWDDDFPKLINVYGSNADSPGIADESVWTYQFQVSCSPPAGANQWSGWTPLPSKIAFKHFRLKFVSNTFASSRYISLAGMEIDVEGFPPSFQSFDVSSEFSVYAMPRDWPGTSVNTLIFWRQHQFTWPSLMTASNTVSGSYNQLVYHLNGPEYTGVFPARNSRMVDPSLSSYEPPGGHFTIQDPGYPIKWPDTRAWLYQHTAETPYKPIVGPVTWSGTFYNTETFPQTLFTLPANCEIKSISVTVVSGGRGGYSEYQGNPESTYQYGQSNYLSTMIDRSFILHNGRTVTDLGSNAGLNQPGQYPITWKLARQIDSATMDLSDVITTTRSGTARYWNHLNSPFLVSSSGTWRVGKWNAYVSVQGVGSMTDWIGFAGALDTPNKIGIFGGGHVTDDVTALSIGVRYAPRYCIGINTGDDIINKFEVAWPGTPSLTCGHIYPTVTDRDRVLSIYNDAVVKDSSGWFNVVITYQVRANPFLKEDNFCFDEFDFKTQPVTSGSIYPYTTGKGWTFANPQNTDLAVINRGANIVVDMDYSAVVGSGYHQYVNVSTFSGGVDILQRSACHYDPVATLEGSKALEIATTSGAWLAPGGGSGLVPTPSGTYTAPFSYITIPSGLDTWTVETKLSAEYLGDKRGQYVGMMLTYEDDPSKFYQLVASASGLINYCHLSPWNRPCVTRVNEPGDELWMRVTKSGSNFDFSWSEDYESWNFLEPFIMVSGTHPNMTGPSSPSPYVAWASAYYSANPPWKAFNGDCNPANNQNSYWYSYTAGFPQWVAFDYGKPTLIYAYRLQYPPNYDDWIQSGLGPKDFQLQGSNTALTNEWTTLDEQENHVEYPPCAWGPIIQIASPGRYRYYRLYITEAQTTSNGDVSNTVRLSQLQLIGLPVDLPAYKTDANYRIGPIVISERDQENHAPVSDALVPVMSSSNTPSPYVVSSSMNATDWKVFGTDWISFNNGNVPNNWTPQWIKVDFGTGNKVIVQGIKFAGSGGSPPGSLYEFRIEGSDDGATWSTVYYAKGVCGGDWVSGHKWVPFYDPTKFLEFYNFTPYQYYRVYIIQPYGSTGNVYGYGLNSLHMGQLQFKGIPSGYTNRQEVIPAYTYGAFDYMKITTASGLESITIGDEWELMLDGKTAVNSSSNTCETSVTEIDPSTYYFEYAPKTNFIPGASVFVRIKAEEPPSFRLTYNKEDSFLYVSVSGNQSSNPFTSRLGEVFEIEGPPLLSCISDESRYGHKIYALATSSGGLGVIVPGDYITVGTGIVYEGQAAINKSSADCYLRATDVDSVLLNDDWSFHTWINTQSNSAGLPNLTLSQDFTCYMAGYTIDKAFDGDVSTNFFDGGPLWQRSPIFYMSAKDPWTINRVRFKSHNISSYWKYDYPWSLYLYYSDISSAGPWTQLQQWTSIGVPDAAATWGNWITVAAPSAHRWYKVWIYQNYGSTYGTSGYWVGFNEMGIDCTSTVPLPGAAPLGKLFTIRDSDFTERLSCGFSVNSQITIAQNGELLGASELPMYTGDTWSHLAVVKKGPWVNSFYNGIKLDGNITLISGGYICPTNTGHIDFFSGISGYMDMLVMEKGARWISSFYTAEKFDEMFMFMPSTPVDFNVNLSVVPDTESPVVVPVAPLPQATEICPASGIVFDILDDFSGVKWEQTRIVIDGVTVWSGGNNMTDWFDDRGTLVYEERGKKDGEWARIDLTPSGLIYLDGINRQLYPPGTVYENSGAWGRRFTYHVPDDTQLTYFDKHIEITMSGTDVTGYLSQFDQIAPHPFEYDYAFDFITNDNIHMGNFFLDVGESERIDVLQAQGRHLWVDLWDSDYPLTDIVEEECSLRFYDGVHDIMCSGTWFTTYTGTEGTASGVLVHRLHYDAGDYYWDGHRTMHWEVHAQNNNPKCHVYDEKEYQLLYGWHLFWLHDDRKPPFEFDKKLPVFVSIKTQDYVPDRYSHSYMLWTAPAITSTFGVEVKALPLGKGNELEVDLIAHSHYLQYSEDVEVELSCKDIDGNELFYTWTFRTEDEPEN